MFLFLCRREKYLNTLLQVEMMLKLWFPQIPTQPVSAASSVASSPACSLRDASGSTPPHKHRDQLHIPVKVRTRIPDCLLMHMNISPPALQIRQKPVHIYPSVYFPEAQAQLDRYRLPRAFPRTSQVPSYQYGREQGERKSQ